MDEDILDGQRNLVSLVEAEGWTVTETELSVYESPWLDGDVPEATVLITARKPFPEAEQDDESPFRVQ